MTKVSIMWPNHPQLNNPTPLKIDSVEYRIVPRRRWRLFWFKTEWHIEAPFSSIGPFDSRKEARWALEQLLTYGNRAFVERHDEDSK